MDAGVGATVTSSLRDLPVEPGGLASEDHARLGCSEPASCPTVGLQEPIQPRREGAVTQQIAFGYMKLDHGISNDGIAILHRQMSECVANHGLVLGRIFSDPVNSAGSAFAELIDALCTSDVDVVVIPSMRHLAQMEGVSTAINEHLKRQTGARVLFAVPESTKRVS